MNFLRFFMFLKEVSYACWGFLVQKYSKNINMNNNPLITRINDNPSFEYADLLLKKYLLLLLM